MEPLSSKKPQKSIKNRVTKIRTRPQIARKIIAFQELVVLEKNKMSERKAADILEIPNSTMQSWRKETNSQRVLRQLYDFFSSPEGADFLQRNIIAVMKLMKCGSSGIRGMQEYLRNSQLDQFVASSEGALQKFWTRCEDAILEFGDKEEKRLAHTMQHKKITLGLDEMFRQGRPCLVAIEVVSNYIVLEKFTEDRKAETWKKELEERLDGFNVTVDQVVSDLCGSIRSCTKALGAEHIPELFHAQQELSRATSAPLASQERCAKKALDESEEKIKNILKQPRRLGIMESKMRKHEIKEAEKIRDQLKTEFRKKEKRRDEARTAIKEIGKVYHPINLNTGKLQSAEEIENQIHEQIRIVQEKAEEVQLTESSFSHIEKACRAFDAIGCYLKYFFVFLHAYIRGLSLTLEEEKFFSEVVFPLCYLRMIWRRLLRKQKEEYRFLRESLECRIRDGPWTEEQKKEWMKKGKELAEKFQRSSSCVEEGMVFFH